MAEDWAQPGCLPSVSDSSYIGLGIAHDLIAWTRYSEPDHGSFLRMESPQNSKQPSSTRVKTFQDFTSLFS